MPANPDTARGFSANVLLDEFAFHQDSRAIWKALFPVISKPGLKLRVISTPNGKGNKFYDLMSGQDDGWSRHVTDIYQAVKDGLPRNIEELRKGAGDDDLWAQEFELKWLDEASAWLPFELITACEHDSAGKPEHYQGGPCFVGVDIASRNDLFVIWVFEKVGDVLWCREIIERRRISFAEQDMLLDDVFRRFNVTRCCMDQTGMGEKPVEDAQRRHGSSRVQGVLFTASAKLDMAVRGKKTGLCFRWEEGACLPTPEQVARVKIALELPPPDRYADARQPGIELLHELVLLVRERPEIGTGGLLEHFAGRDESAALQKLAAQELPGEEPALRAEFLGAIAQLEKQVLQQRIDELQQRLSELDEAEKYELRALLQARLQP